jgi:hypothetical protein
MPDGNMVRQRGGEQAFSRSGNPMMPIFNSNGAPPSGGRQIYQPGNPPQQAAGVGSNGNPYYTNPNYPGIRFNNPTAATQGRTGLPPGYGPPPMPQTNGGQFGQIGSQFGIGPGMGFGGNYNNVLAAMQGQQQGIAPTKPIQYNPAPLPQFPPQQGQYSTQPVQQPPVGIYNPQPTQYM